MDITTEGIKATIDKAIKDGYYWIDRECSVISTAIETRIWVLLITFNCETDKYGKNHLKKEK